VISRKAIQVAEKQYKNFQMQNSDFSSISRIIVLPALRVQKKRECEHGSLKNTIPSANMKKKMALFGYSMTSRVNALWKTASR